MSIERKRYYSVPELAELIGYTKQGLYKAIKEGRLRVERVGTLRLVPWREATRWIEKNQNRN